MTVFRLFLIFILFSIASAQAGGAPQNLEVMPLAVETEGGWYRFEVEVARTPKEQSQGLMYRENMADHQGMLFHYRFPQSVGFWMKNTYIPLDLIFIQPDGTIVNIARDTEPHSLAIINSVGWVTGVLELNGGLTEELGIAPGDIVHHEIFGNAVEQSDD